MPLLNLPTDVLSQIFRHCNPVERITETCREFAAVAYSIPSLWCEIHIGPRQLNLDGPELLRSRLGRAGIQTLKVSISTPNIVNATIISEVCIVLAKHNTQIKQIQIDSQIALEAGNILSSIYPSPLTIFPELTTLSIRVEEDPDLYFPTWPQLDVFLQHFMPSLPNLQTLSIPTHFACIPVFKAETDPFSHLHTLVFDGSTEEEHPSMALVVGLLHHTPQLETLWLKTLTRETSVTLANPTIPGSAKNSEDIPIPTILLRLSHLAITTPGAGSDLLLCIQAPALRNLHLDGSRGPLYRERVGEDVLWTQYDAARVLTAMKKLAQGSPDLRNLALTGTYLTEDGWRWLFLGSESERPPFRQLESLALRELNSLSRPPTFGFNGALFMQYLVQSDILLQRLSLRRCMFSLDGSALLFRFKNAITRDPTTSYKLEIDSSCTGVTEQHLKTLEETGVIVINHGADEVGEYEWWSQRHEIDASDLNIY